MKIIATITLLSILLLSGCDNVCIKTGKIKYNSDGYVDPMSIQVQKGLCNFDEEEIRNFTTDNNITQIEVNKENIDIVIKELRNVPIEEVSKWTLEYIWDIQQTIKN